MGCERDGRHRMGLGVARASTALDVPIVMSAASEAPTFSVRRIVFVVIALGAISVLSLIVAGAASLISLADRIHPVAGTIVFWSVCLAAGFFCALLRDSVRAVAGGAHSAGRNFGVQARGVSASVVRTAGN